MNFLLTVTCVAIPVLGAVIDLPSHTAKCLHLPEDHEWPTIHEWKQLNASVGGHLSAGTPLAQACHATGYDLAECQQIQANYVLPQT